VPTGTATALIAVTSAAVVPGGSSTVVAAGSSRWIDQSGTSWLELYQRPPTCACSAVPAQLPDGGAAAYDVSLSTSANR
jgi:hypothetical protein